jgi:hypothetical protein
MLLLNPTNSPALLEQTSKRKISELGDYFVNGGPVPLVSAGGGRFRGVSQSHVSNMSTEVDDKESLIAGHLPTQNGNGHVMTLTLAEKELKQQATAATQAAASFSFWSIAVIVTLIFLLHGWISEMLVISVVSNHFKLGWFFALLTVIGQWIPTIPRRGWNKSEFRVEHIIVGVAHCLSLGMSNSGGMLVEYNTYSLFKSGKVVFVMLVSWLTLGVQPSPQELSWGLGLMAGLIMLTGADETYARESRRETSPIAGAALLFSGISGNALVSVGQQAALQRRALQKKNR